MRSSPARLTSVSSKSNYSDATKLNHIFQLVNLEIIRKGSEESILKLDLFQARGIVVNMRWLLTSKEQILGTKIYYVAIPKHVQSLFIYLSSEWLIFYNDVIMYKLKWKTSACWMRTLAHLCLFLLRSLHQSSKPAKLSKISFVGKISIFRVVFHLNVTTVYVSIPILSLDTNLSDQFPLVSRLLNEFHHRFSFIRSLYNILFSYWYSYKCCPLTSSFSSCEPTS